MPGRYRDESAARTFAAAHVPVDVRDSRHRERHVDRPGPASATPARRRCAAPSSLGGRDDADLVRQLERVAADAAAGRPPRRRRRRTPRWPGAGPGRHRLRRRGRPRRQGRQGAQGASRRRPRDVADAARAGRVPRPRPGAARSRSSTPGRARSTSTCSPTCARGEPIVADTFAEADRIMTPLLGRPLSSYIFVDATDPAGREAARAAADPQTEITQPAVLTTDLALTRLLDAYGVRPDMVMGHSLGEYGALVAAGALTLRRRAGGGQRPRPRRWRPLRRRQRRDGRGLRPARRDRADRRGRSTATSSSPTSTAPARR